MSLQDPDGAPWRTPAAAALLLDRKFAYAFAGRGAGVIQWAWNINPYQPIDNEATIGVNRQDGTAKVERDVFPRFAAFFAQVGNLLLCKFVLPVTGLKLALQLISPAAILEGLLQLLI